MVDNSQPNTCISGTSSRVPMLNVFVSSTLHDLRKFRAEACAFVRALQLNPVAMEHWPARSLPTRDAVKAELEKCQLYVGIVAFRHGCTLPQTRGTSFVQFEYRLAKRMGIPRLILMLDENARWPRAYIDTNQQPIDEFRRRLMSEVTVCWFKDMSGFRTGCVKSLYAEIQKTDGYKLLNPIARTMIDAAGLISRDLAHREAQMAGKGTATDAEYQWCIPEISRCNLGSRFYVSRNSVSKCVSDWLVRRSEPYCLLLGPSGVGKTNFLIEYMRHIIRDFDGVLPAMEGQHTGSLSKGFPQVPLYMPLGRAFDPSLSLSECFARYINNNGAGDMEVVHPQSVAELTRSGTALVILDGLDELARTKGEDTCKRLFGRVEEAVDARHSRVIISCRDHIYRRLADCMPPSSRVHCIKLRSFSPDELRTAVEQRWTSASPARNAILHLAIGKLARNPLLLEMMRSIPHGKWRQLANEPKPALLYDMWFREIIRRRDPSNCAFERAVDQLGSIAQLMLQDRTDLVHQQSLERIGLPVKGLRLLTGEPFGILIQQTSEEWGFVHDSFREFALARRITNELTANRFVLLTSTDGLDYVGAETYQYLQGLQEWPALLKRVESLLRSRPFVGECWHNFLNNALEILGMMIGNKSDAKRLACLILDLLEPALRPLLSDRNLYNLVRCLERLHPTAPRPYFQHILADSRPAAPTPYCFGAAAVRGFQRTKPEVGYFPIEVVEPNGKSPLQARASKVLVGLLEQALQSCRPHLAVNCSHALIRWLHPAQVRDVESLLRSKLLKSSTKGNIFHAFRLRAPAALSESSLLFSGMDLRWVALAQTDLPPDFTFYDTRFRDCQLTISNRRFKGGIR